MTPIRVWKEDGYKIELFDYGEEYRGKASLSYIFYHKDESIFEGSNFCPTVLYSYSSDKTVASLLGFLSLKPGDTDSSYFDSYSPEQLAFVKSHGDYISLLASELESY